MEIRYDIQARQYRIEHDGRIFSEAEIVKHMKGNGHPKERAWYNVPVEAWRGAKDIADKIDRIFNEKEARRH